ncbi:hypothetical protein BU17DRAFT_62709 [Hysterangium stoloniferum]|nr:hypothetical protein BU17DRAFT_62709 [Hysterangium stoloniferum]
MVSIEAIQENLWKAKAKKHEWEEWKATAKEVQEEEGQRAVLAVKRKMAMEVSATKGQGKEVLRHEDDEDKDEVDEIGELVGTNKSHILCKIHSGGDLLKAEDHPEHCER